MLLTLILFIPAVAAIFLMALRLKNDQTGRWLAELLLPHPQAHDAKLIGQRYELSSSHRLRRLLA